MSRIGNKPNHLPLPTGPYVPGAYDLMFDYKIDGIFIRMYYPTNFEKDDEDNYEKWIPWVIDDNYANGIASVLMLPQWLVKGAIWWFGNTYVPVLYGENVRKDKKMKCIILSHGLGGNRFLYSYICYELASYGFIVFALEHRDQSATHTYYYENLNNVQNDIKTFVKYKKLPLNKGHFEERNKQVNIRSNECSKVLDLILNINKGIIPINILEEINCKKPTNFNLKDLQGILDIDNIIMMGHSFGGASALLTLGRRPELKLGILLDPWMFPIKNDKLNEKIEQPLLFINTQTFHVALNSEAMSKYLTDNTKREMYTLLHTTHENQSDSVLLIGYWLNWFMKKLNPLIALKINNCLIFKFLNKHINYPENINEFDDLIKEQNRNIEKGLTKPWN